MLRTLRGVMRDERGAELVGWVGMTVIVFFMIVGIWTALFGGPGQELKREINNVATRYANGFEGGLGTRGPSGGVPEVGKMPNIDGNQMQGNQMRGNTVQGDQMQGDQMQGDQMAQPPALPGTQVQGNQMQGDQVPAAPGLPGTQMQGDTVRGDQVPAAPGLPGTQMPQPPSLPMLQIVGIILVGLGLSAGFALWSSRRQRRI